jgi:hypothetical protein
MSVITDKILSYGPERYWSLDEGFIAGNSFQTNLGVDGISANGTWSWRNNTSGRAIKVPGAGPAGEEVLDFLFISGNSTAAIPQIQMLNDNSNIINVQDLDYSWGLWFRFNNAFEGTGDTASVRIQRLFGFTAGGLAIAASMGVGGPSSSYLGKVRLSDNTQWINSPRVDDGEWHYIAIRETLINNNRTRYHYLDGVLVGTLGPGAWTGNNNESLFFSVNNQSFLYPGVTPIRVQYSHLYIATSNQIDENAIAEIWESRNASPPPVSTVYDVKHYNGTEWEASTGQKYYDGNDWVDWNNVSEPKRWDGTQWIDLS